MKHIAAISLVILFLLSGCLPPNLPLSPTPAPTEPSLAATPFPTQAQGETLPGPTYTAIPAVETPTFTAVPAVEMPYSGVTPEFLKNFTYQVTDFNTQAALQNGTFRNDVIDAMLVEPIAVGDLNGDGARDGAVILAIHTGGSGTFFYLFVVIDQNGGPQQAALSSIGDRQGIKNLQIVDGQIILDYRTQGPDDPLCCPSQHRIRSYRLENNTLNLVSEQILDD